MRFEYVVLYVTLYLLMALFLFAISKRNSQSVNVYGIRQLSFATESSSGAELSRDASSVGGTRRLRMNVYGSFDAPPPVVERFEYREYSVRQWLVRSGGIDFSLNQLRRLFLRWESLRVYDRVDNVVAELVSVRRMS